MINNNLKYLESFCGGKWNKSLKNQNFIGFSNDTRKLKTGEIFVALNGKKDGHSFINDAFANGAVGAIVKNGFFENSEYNLLYVENPLKAFQEISAKNRSDWSGCMVGITGSAGKTTVKELCYSIVSQIAPVHKTYSNFNNHIGIPLTLSSIDNFHKFSITEIGMSNPGEIKELSQLVNPDIALITEIGLAHIAKFNSIEDIANEKSDIFTCLDNKGTAILDIDSPWYNLFKSKTNANILKISMNGLGDINGNYLEDNTIVIDKITYRLPQPGNHMARNVLKAIALAKLLDININNIKEGLEKYKAPKMRWEECLINDIKWINDAYNSNPLSVKESLETFINVKGNKKWVVIGKMNELGHLDKQEHQYLFEYLDSLDLKGWIAIGMSKNLLWKSSKSFFVENICSAVDILKANLSKDDVVLLKGSRSEKLENILDIFKED